MEIEIRFPVKFSPAVLTALAVAAIAAAGCEQKGTVAGIAGDKALEAGEKMYRSGVILSGEHLKTETSAGVEARGTAFSCAGCHMRSGMGSVSEGVRTLPVNGAKLFHPLYPNFQSLSEEERAQMVPARFQCAPLRPVYTEASLAAAIRTGIDPAGRRLNQIMPRYRIGDRDMKVLINYLENLSAKPSPGIDDTTIKLATIITDDVSHEDRAALLEPLERSIRDHNNLGGGKGNLSSTLSYRELSYGFRKRTLAIWVLTGSPDTWISQLDDYYSKEPVFAVVGGISNLSWKPIHEFCESRQIPCLFPITDQPVVSDTGYYTFYFSKGLYQEGEAAARYLGNRPDEDRKCVIQIVGPGLEPEAVAKGFDDAWTGMGNAMAGKITLEADMKSAELESLLQRVPSTCFLLLWTGADSYEALDSMAGWEGMPSLVFMSSSLLGGKLWTLPEKARPFTFLTYPFREPGPKSVLPPMGGPPLKVDKEFRRNDRRIASRTATTVEIVMDRLSRLERNFYRDYLLELTDALDDQLRTDYEKLTFTPGKRYASEGCYIMQLSRGQKPVLQRRSDWVIF